MDSSQATQGHKFHTFGGVFTPSILTILGAIMFMRAGFVVGEAGIISALIILAISKGITLFTTLSISAVSTNLPVRGGGAYFLISRVLGAETGGALGLVLFIAQALSVPFYVLGFTEAIVLAIPTLEPYFLAITLIVAALLFGLAFAGASWSIKVQYYIMVILGLSILAFMSGAALVFDPQTFNANMGPGFTAIAGREGAQHSFWTIFAIYFPAVTGILAGVNMSGDLRDPAKSIPKGTLLAVVVGAAVYLAQLLLMGGAFDRASLISQPFEVLKDNALFNMGWLVVAGVAAATLSSALGSYLGAPRILQAVSRDKLLGFLQPFAKGSRVGDEPRAALVLTGFITLLVLVWAGNSGGNGFNMVAALITMFFLYTYGMLNVAAFIESVAQNPSFRPRFKAFHWLTALLGALGCLGAALLIDPLQAVIAVVVIAALFWYLRTRQLRTAFGDARRGFIYSAARNSLLRLADIPEDPRNWRPTIIAFTGNPTSRVLLVDMAVWLESGRGIVQLVNIIKSPITESSKHFGMALRQLTSYCKRERIPAFPVVLAADNLEEGVVSALQTAAVGPIRPNVAMFGWNHEGFGSLLTHLKNAEKLGMSLVVAKGSDIPQPGGTKRIDIYWRGEGNGSLMLLLAHLLSHNWEWANARIRLIRIVQRKEGVEPARIALLELAHSARIDCDIHVEVSSGAFKDSLQRLSGSADCVFLGLMTDAPNGPAAWQAYLESLLEGMPLVLLVHNTGGSNLLM